MSKNRSVRSPLRYNKIANLSRRGKIAAVAVLFLSIVSLAAIGSTAGRNAVAGPIAAYFGFSQPEARPTAATVQDKERGTLIAQIDEKAEPAFGQEVPLFPFSSGGAKAKQRWACCIGKETGSKKCVAADIR